MTVRYWYTLDSQRNKVETNYGDASGRSCGRGQNQSRKAPSVAVTIPPEQSRMTTIERKTKNFIQSQSNLVSLLLISSLRGSETFCFANILAIRCDSIDPQQESDVSLIEWFGQALTQKNICFRPRPPSQGYLVSIWIINGSSLWIWSGLGHGFGWIQNNIQKKKEVNRIQWSNRYYRIQKRMKTARWNGSLRCCSPLLQLDFDCKSQVTDWIERFKILCL